MRGCNGVVITVQHIVWPHQACSRPALSGAMDAGVELKETTARMEPRCELAFCCCSRVNRRSRFSTEGFAAGSTGRIRRDRRVVGAVAMPIDQRATIVAARSSGPWPSWRAITRWATWCAGVASARERRKRVTRCRSCSATARRSTSATTAATSGRTSWSTAAVAGLANANLRPGKISGDKASAARPWSQRCARSRTFRGSCWWSFPSRP